MYIGAFFFSSRRRHTRWPRDWSSDVCSSDLKGGTSGAKGSKTFIAPGLLAGAQKNPGQKIHVIIQSSAGVSDAKAKLAGLGASVRKQLDLICAVAVDIPAGNLNALSNSSGLTITADAPIKLSAVSVNYSDDLWPYESGNAKLWG